MKKKTLGQDDTPSMVDSFFITALTDLLAPFLHEL